MSGPTGDITQLLHARRACNHEAENELFARVLPHMQATELVKQVYFRLVAAKDRDWQNRQHFFAIAARAMRRYLIDYARGRSDAGFVAIEGIDNLVKTNSAKLDLAVMIDRLLDELGETSRSGAWWST